MRCYSGFGLTIKAPIPFPELPNATESAAFHPDIEIEFGDVERHPDAIDDTGRGLWVVGDQACYSWQGVGVFLVSSGRHVLVEAHREATQEALRLSILGPVLALALEQRGFFNLHASAVLINGAAVAFLGGHGWGKSTIAAMLQQLGHPVISDDLVALEPETDRVVPSFPQLKLWPDAAGALGHASDQLPLIHPEADKRALRFRWGDVSGPVPLKRLYLLGRGETIEIEGIPPKEAFEELIRHSYSSRFGPAYLKAIDLRPHFLRLSALVRTIPIRRLRRPATLRQDPGLAGSIERAIFEDLES